MRNKLILLTLALVTASSVGCAGRCRNLFRRGSPCFGTARVAPAVIGAPMAIAAPIRQPAPVVQPMVMPQMIQQPVCCPQPAPACVPCNPCPCPCPSDCSPCESGIQGGGYFGGYYDGASVNGGCQNCGGMPTFEQGVIPPGAMVVPGGEQGTLGNQNDPGPTTQN